MTRRALVLLVGLSVALVAAIAPGGLPGVTGGEASATTQKFAIDIGGDGNPCAVTDTGEQWCWGPQWDGGLANGTGGYSSYEDAPASAPVRSSISNVATTSGTCARTTGNAIRCWGSDGIIEDGTGSLFSDPPWGTSTPGDYGFADAVEVAGRCARAAGGTVQCYGWDNWGQVGSGGTGWPGSGYVTPPPSAASAAGVTGLTDVVDISANRGTNCAVKSDGTVWCWGLGGNGELGNGQSGTTTYPCAGGSCFDLVYHSTPVQVSGITDAISVHQSCAIRTGGKVSCWGKNQGNRFGVGDVNAIIDPTEMAVFEDAIDLAVGWDTTCAVYANGTVGCLGAGAPASVDMFTVAREVVPVWFDNMCVRSADGTIACWGGNRSGELGAGFVTESGRISNPVGVIGFGGELPEDDLEVTITVTPQEVLLALEPDGSPVPQTVDVEVKIKNTSPEDVPSVKAEATLSTSLIRGDVKAITQIDGPDPDANGVDETELGTLDEGDEVTVDYVFEVDGDGIFGINTLVRWADPITLQTETGFAETSVEVELDDGFEIDLTGEPTSSPAIVRVSAVIRNVSEDDVTGITYVGDGLTLDVLAGDEPLRLLTGPIPELPNSLASGEQLTVNWTLLVQEAGAVVFGLDATGTNSVGDAVAFEELSVEISEGLIRSIDLQNEAVAGFEQYLIVSGNKLKEVYEESISDIGNETEAFRRKQYDSWRSLGYGDTMARWLANGDVKQQAFSNYMNGLWNGARESVNELGAQDGEKLWKLVDTASDPVKRNAYAQRMIDRAKEEYGYLEAGFSDPGSLGAVDLAVAYDAWVAAGNEVVESTGLAFVGQQEIWRIERGEFRRDPLAFSTKIGNRHGRQGGTVGYYTGVGVVEEVATGGLGPVTRAGNALEAGVDGLRNTSRASGAVDAGSDAAGRATRRFAEAERTIERFQDIPYGSTVDFDTLERLGGFSRADAQAIDQLVRDVKTEFGVDIEMVFRTAEPLSVGIDGVGKRSFTKEKAVGQMDLLLGAPESLAGKVAIFKPQPLPANVLEAAELANPGFTARYQKRLDTQQKNWDAFQAGSARTQDIAAASQKYGGVTIIDNAPGNPTYGIKYVEQLDDAEFMAAFRDANPGVTDQQLEALRSHPTRTPANLEIEVVDGAFAVSDNVRVRQPDGSFETVKKPVISDYDGQAVIPVDGEWPDGRRGQIETFIKNRMDQIGRSGRHGWSDTANDLPSNLFNLAAEYVMSTTHPSVAGRVAEDLARRFDLLADEFTRKANRLEDTIGDLPTLALKEKRRAEITKLRELAASYRTFTKESILERWPPGEKTIVFTPGRITVGSNQGS